MAFLKKLFQPKATTIVMPDQTPIATPTVSAPAVMPEADSVEVNRAKAAEVRRRMQRGGRASTIMSQAAGGGTGSDSFDRSTLG